VWRREIVLFVEDLILNPEILRDRERNRGFEYTGKNGLTRLKRAKEIAGSDLSTTLNFSKPLLTTERTV
jgi:hypothetical protein